MWTRNAGRGGGDAAWPAHAVWLSAASCRSPVASSPLAASRDLAVRAAATQSALRYLVHAPCPNTPPQAELSSTHGHRAASCIVWCNWIHDHASWHGHLRWFTWTERLESVACGQPISPHQGTENYGDTPGNGRRAHMVFRRGQGGAMARALVAVHHATRWSTDRCVFGGAPSQQAVGRRVNIPCTEY